MKTTRLLKNSQLARFEEELKYGEPTTYKAEVAKVYRLMDLEAEVSKRMRKVKEELEELEYLEEKYSNLSQHARIAADEMHGHLKVAGYTTGANKKQCEDAYYQFYELECYVGNPFQNSYRKVEDGYKELTTVESCKYVRDFF